MARRDDRNKSPKENVNIDKGVEILRRHNLFLEILKQHVVHFSLMDSHHEKHYRRILSSGNAYVTNEGYIYLNRNKNLPPEQWAYCLAHCVLHLCFGHLDKNSSAIEKIVYDIMVTDFLRSLKFYAHPHADVRDMLLPGSNDFTYLRELVEDSIINSDISTSLYSTLNVAGIGDNDILGDGPTYSLYKTKWSDVFSVAVESALHKSLLKAGGYDPSAGSGFKITKAEQARRWFISNYPLLAGLAASFTIVEDRDILLSQDVNIAAVCEESKEIFINENFKHSDEQYRFIIAHLLLHVGLRHKARRLGRDQYLWNVACDYVINQWLIEMKIGSPPDHGLLTSDDFKDLSAESIYDRIILEPRKHRRLMTFRGIELPDMIDRKFGQIESDPSSLDRLFREYLNRGLPGHIDAGRGLLPASLIEEIKAVARPPLGWDVDLGRWFDEEFAHSEKRRSYGILSRRQYSTPDIPRPGRACVPVDYTNTFGVVFDTSLSMDREIIAKGLGSIISYSIAKDITRIRLVYCDAIPYDEGYIPVDDLMSYVNVKGRGGTILQPAVDLLERDKGFPKDAPLLVITDGFCDNLTITRKHAFLLPEGRNLPFVPKGKVFRLS